MMRARSRGEIMFVVLLTLYTLALNSKNYSSFRQSNEKDATHQFMVTLNESSALNIGISPALQRSWDRIEVRVDD